MRTRDNTYTVAALRKREEVLSPCGTRHTHSLSSISIHPLQAQHSELSFTFCELFNKQGTHRLFLPESPDRKIGITSQNMATAEARLGEDDPLNRLPTLVNDVVRRELHKITEQDTK